MVCRTLVFKVCDVIPKMVYLVAGRVLFFCSLEPIISVLLLYSKVYAFGMSLVIWSFRYILIQTVYCLNYHP